MVIEEFRANAGLVGGPMAAVVDNWRSGATVTAIDASAQRYTSQIGPIEKERGYYKNVADHLLAGTPLIITPEWAKATIQCIEGCEIAARQNRIVEVDFDF